MGMFVIPPMIPIMSQSSHVVSAPLSDDASVAVILFLLVFVALIVIGVVAMSGAQR